jgi:sugar phosphate isomerase/epimerase
MKTSRRNFIRTGGAVLASTSLLSTLPLGLMSFGPSRPRKFGFQSWTIREKLTENFAPTLKEMADLGYSEVEMCSPLGYKGTGFERLHSMTGSEMKSLIEEAGLICRSSHFTDVELKESLDNRIEWAQQIGMSQMVCSMFRVPQNATLDDWLKAAGELNEIGEKTAKAGIQMVYHNHHFEFQKIDGKLIYPELMKVLDPDLVKMQFQVAVIEQGYMAQDYFRKYPGRFISAHLADYSKEKASQVPIGQGDVDWDDLFIAAEIGGVKNFFVEMDPETFPESAQYLLA